MSDKQKQTVKQRLVASALQLAEHDQWKTANLSTIAKTADVPLSQVIGVVRSKAEVFSLILDDLTQRVLDEVGEISDDMSTRDALFDLVMTRFELMNAQRQAFLNLNSDISNSIGLSAKALNISKEHMSQLAELSGVETTGLAGSGKVLALTYIYLDAFKTWMSDETDDLSATMKKLDTELSKAESWAIEIQNFDLSSIFSQKKHTEAQNRAEQPEA